MKVKKTVDVRDNVQAPREDSALLCNKSGHLLLVISHLGIPINLPLALNTPSVWLASHWSRIIIPWLWYRLRTSGLIRRGSLVILAGPVADLALDPDAWADSDPEAWMDSEPEAWVDSEPDADPVAELETAPVGDPISVCSSSDWETVTTLVIAFWEVPLVARGAVGEVFVLGGTYAGSFSMSVSSSINLKLGATYFDLPCFA